MTLDRNSLKKLLFFSNAQIRSLIEKLAGEGGLDTSKIDTSDEALNELRRMINTATDQELQEALDTIIKQANNTDRS